MTTNRLFRPTWVRRTEPMEPEELGSAGPLRISLTESSGENLLKVDQGRVVLYDFKTYKEGTPTDIGFFS